MPNMLQTVMAWIAVMTVLIISGCSSAPHRADGAAAGGTQAGEGPAITGVRPEPRMIELNRELQPMHPSEVLAEVRDSGARVNQVMLRFEGIPMEIPMENIGGNLWRAELTQRQLEVLAVNGKIAHYEAHVIATNDEGKETKTPAPVEVAVKAPDTVASGVGSG